MAAALDRMSKGQKRATHHPIIRAHDSDDEDSDKFDLEASLFKAAFDFIPTDWFPSSQLLAKLHNLSLKAKENRKHQAHPFIADSVLESWVPTWVGHGESPAARDQLIRNWKRTDSLDSARFLSIVANFGWRMRQWR